MLAKILEALQFIADFFGGAKDYIVDLLVNFGEWAMLHFLIGWLEMKLWLLEIAWSIGKSLIQSLGVAEHINSALAALPPDIAAGVDFVGVPEALNIILTAGATKLAMRFIPGI